MNQVVKVPHNRVRGDDAACNGNSQLADMVDRSLTAIHIK